MRLSDIKGERAIEVVADLIDPIASIAEDEQAVALFKRQKVPEGMTAREFTVQRVRECVPQLLRDHKSDLIAILSAIEGVTAEEYAASLTLAKIVSDVTELVTDKAFIDFLV